MNLTSCSKLRPIFARRPTGLRTFFCALAVIAAWCFSPTQADASCGSYVVVDNPSAEYLRNKPIEHSMPSTDPACPCQGPQCRASDRTPVMPVAAPVTPDYGLELLVEEDSAPRRNPGTSNLEDSRFESEAHLLCPDPPPRSLS